MRRLMFLVIVIIFTFILALPLVAQPVEPPLIPIDGGVSFLLAAGALFGARKVYQLSRKKGEN